MIDQHHKYFLNSHFAFDWIIMQIFLFANKSNSFIYAALAKRCNYVIAVLWRQTVGIMPYFHNHYSSVEHNKPKLEDLRKYTFVVP